MMTTALVLLIVLCSVMAIRARRLLTSALWLAGVSAFLALFLYRLGAAQVSVIELSVGAGLVTVLLVFAVNIAGDEVVEGKPVIPRPLAWLVSLAPLALLGALILPSIVGAAPAAAATFANVMWQDRALDVVVQVVLIFAGVLGLLGLLAEKEAPLRPSAAQEVAARRQRDLLTMETAARPEEVEA